MGGVQLGLDLLPRRLETTYSCPKMLKMTPCPKLEILMLSLTTQPCPDGSVQLKPDLLPRHIRTTYPCPKLLKMKPSSKLDILILSLTS